MLETVPAAVQLPDATEKDKFKGHRAGHDAFMTGFSFAWFIAQKLQESKKLEEGRTWIDLLDDIRNRICLSGKEFPLFIQKSHYVKSSKNHLEKYDRIMNHKGQTEAPSESWIDNFLHYRILSKFLLYNCNCMIHTNDL